VSGNGKRQEKQIHLYLRGDQVDDYEVVKQSTGISNDSDLVRYLFRQEANRVRAKQTPPWGMPIVQVDDEVRGG